MFDERPDLKSETMAGFVSELMWYLRFDDHRLELNPVLLLLVDTSLVSLLCLLVLQEEHTDEEVEEEEAANEDKDDEEDGLAWTGLVLWPIVSSCDIDRLVHDVWPAF